MPAEPTPTPPPTPPAPAGPPPLPPARLPGGARGGPEPDYRPGLVIFAWLAGGGETITLAAAGDDQAVKGAPFAVPWTAIDWWIPI